MSNNKCSPPSLDHILPDGICLFSGIRAVVVFCPDDQQRRGKFVEIDRHPILILDLLPIVLNLKDAAARVYEHFQIILFPDEVLPQKPGLFVGHGQYHLR